jgi:hypothetical protein
LQTSSSQVQSFLISAKSSFLESKNILDEIDKIYAITNKYKYLHPEFLVYLSAKNPSDKNMTETTFFVANNNIGQTQALLSSLESSQTTTIQQIEQFHVAYKSFLQDLSSTVSYARNGISNSIAGSVLSQSQIDSWYSQLSTYSSKVISLSSSLNSDIKSLQTTESDIIAKRNEVSSYEAQIAVAKETLNIMNL